MTDINRALPPLIPVEDFFENPERAGAQISPDGTRISYLAPESNRLNVWVRTLGRDDDVCVTHDHTRGILQYWWSRDSRWILYLQDNGGDENFHLWAAEVADPTAPSRDLTPFENVRVMMVDLPRSEPGQATIALNRENPQLFDAYRLDLDSGELELVAKNPGNVAGWTADFHGAVRAATAQTPEGDSEILVRDTAEGPFRTLRVYSNEDSGVVVGFTPDGASVWVGTAEGLDTMGVVTVDVDSGDQTLVDHDELADLADLVASDRTGELQAAAYLRDRRVMHFFDPELEQRWKRAEALHSGDLASVSMDLSEERWVVTFDDDREPGVTYFIDHATGESQFLFRPRPKLDPAQLAPMTPVTVTSRDGLRLWSYLTLPIGIEPVGLPMVLLVHGGPWARDQWGYDPEAQFLANRGYAVLQVNYRGSHGFGKAFEHAAEHEFSGRMHDDLIDAVEWAIGQGYADRSRVGIYGGSYGGYATLVGVTFTPDVFAAAVDYVGPSSLVTLIRSFPDYWRPMLAGSWFRYCGDPGTEEEPNEDVVADLLARSPISLVDRIRTPLLVVQGANDPRVTKLESDNIVAALRERGVEVDYICKDDEGHGFQNPENRLDLYRAMETFLARHLGGRSSS